MKIADKSVLVTGAKRPARVVRVLCRPVGIDDSGDDAVGTAPESIVAKKERNK